MRNILFFIGLGEQCDYALLLVEEQGALIYNQLRYELQEKGIFDGNA